MKMLRLFIGPNSFIASNRGNVRRESSNSVGSGFQSNPKLTLHLPILITIRFLRARNVKGS